MNDSRDMEGSAVHAWATARSGEENVSSGKAAFTIGELSREFGAIPLGEATPQQIWAFAGQAHDVNGDLGGKTRPWHRGQGRQRGHRGAG